MGLANPDFIKQAFPEVIKNPDHKNGEIDHY